MDKQIHPIPTPAKEVINFLGEDITFEFNHYAYKADAALTIQKGETVLLITVTCSKLKSDLDYFPLSVEYIEKYYAGGIISSSRFIKRETRPSDDAVLKARQIDHAIRSLFPKGYNNEVGVVVTVLAYDGENDPEQLAVIGASTALMISSIPFRGPSASIKVGLDEEDNVIWSPRVSVEESLKMDLIISLVDDKVLNIEGWADQVPEAKLIEILKEASKKLSPIMEFQSGLVTKYGKEKQPYSDKPAPQNVIDKVDEEYKERITIALFNKEIRQMELKNIKSEIVATYPDFSARDVEFAVEYIARKVMRAGIMTEGKRTSGRKLTEIRELKVEVGVLPRVHGSAVFTRGTTQCLSILTLGSIRMAQTLESFEGEAHKRFMHHYNSPNYSYGDAGRFSYYPGRREIGHGNIGENGLRKMIPAEETFPYTIRVNSEIMSSNGSTSMAATCATTMALLDGGVPIKAMVGGIALGLITSEENVADFRLLTDIEDVEDFYGDMDFKVTGTTTGITAIQLDNKLAGVPISIIAAALEQSKEARLEILATMGKILAQPRDHLGQYAPKVEMVKINPEKIGELIGPGGKIIRGIIEDCNNEVEIDIQESGQVFIMAVKEEIRARAVAMVKAIVEEAEIGKTYSGTIDKITEYGMFINISPNISGLVHISEVGEGFVKNLSDKYKESDTVEVKVISKDNLGRLKLSIKQANT